MIGELLIGLMISDYYFWHKIIMNNNYLLAPAPALKLGECILYPALGMRLKHYSFFKSPFYSLNSIQPTAHYCHLPGTHMFIFKFELPSMLELVELNSGTYLRLPNRFIYSACTDSLNFIHDLPNIKRIDLSWLYSLPRNQFTFEPANKFSIHTYGHLNYINDSNIILEHGYIHLPLYFDYCNIRVYGINSLIIPFDILLPSKIMTGSYFTLIDDFITIEEDKRNDFKTCLCLLLDQTTPIIVKTIIISRLAKYNISHGRNICQHSIDLTSYYDDEGHQIKPLPDKYNLTHRSMFHIWQSFNVPQIMNYLRSIPDVAFQNELSHFNDLQHR